MSDAASAAAAMLVDELVGHVPEAPAPAEPVASEQTAPEAVVEPATNLPTWEADTSGLDFLDEPEPDEEVTAPTFTDEADEEPDYGEDDGTQKLRAQNKKLEKQLLWEREQRVKSSLKEWRAEAGRRFPLADVEDIQADSRRAFLRKANEQHARVEKKIKPFIDVVESLKAEVIAETKAETRAAAVQAYGRPTTGPGVAVVEAAEAEARIAATRKPTGNLYDSVRARLSGTNYLGLSE